MGLHSIGPEKRKELFWVGRGFPCIFNCGFSKEDQHTCARKHFNARDSYYCVCPVCKELPALHYYDQEKYPDPSLICLYCTKDIHPKIGEG